MANDRRFQIKVLGDTSHALKSLDELGAGAQDMGNRFTRLGKTAVGAFGAISVASVASRTVSAASDLGESINAVRVTFGEAADGVLALSENSAKAVGLSAREFNGFAVQFAGFTKQLATDGQSAGDVTDELMTRVADLASVMNKSVPEAAQIFQSALAGEAESARRLGIDVSAAAVQMYALRVGLVDSASQMTEAIKVQARYGLMMEQTEQMAGDFANTSDSLANQTRVLKATLDDLAATAGQALVPVLETLLGIVGPLLDAFMSLPKPVQQMVTIGGMAAIAFRSMSMSLQGLGTSAKTANIAAGGLTAGLTILIIALQDYAKEKAAINAISTEFIEAMKLEGQASEDAARQIIVNKFATESLGDATEELGLTADQVADAILGDVAAMEEISDAMKTATVQTVDNGDGLEYLFLQLSNVRGAEGEFFEALRQTTEGMNLASRSADRLDDATGDLADTAEVGANVQRVLNIMTGDYSKQLDLTAGDVFYFTENLERLAAVQRREAEKNREAVGTYIAVGNALQWPIAKTRELVTELGLLDGMSVEVQIELGLFTEAEAALKMLDLQIRALRTSMSALGQGQFMQQRLAPLFQIRNELVALIAEGASTPFSGSGGGGASPVDSAQDDFDRYVEGVVGYAKDLMGDRFAESLFEGTPDAIRDTFRNIMDDVADMAEADVTNSLSAFVGNVQGKFAELAELSRLRETLQDELDGVNKIVEQSAKLFSPDLDLSDDAELSLTEQMRKRVEAARQFMYDVGWLKQHHWPPAIINEVLSAGIAGGSKMVAAFKAMSFEEQFEFRGMFSALERYADYTKTIIFEGLGGHELQNALDGTNTEMADLVRAIQVDLGNAFDNFLDGLGAQIDRIAPAATFIHPILGEVPVISSRTASKTPSGTAVNITINAGMGTDGQSLGKQIVDVLNTYAASGGAPLSAQVVSR